MGCILWRCILSGPLNPGHHGVFEPRPCKRGMGRAIKTVTMVGFAKGWSVRFTAGKDRQDIKVKF